jgi:hypothetical protein
MSSNKTGQRRKYRDGIAMYVCQACGKDFRGDKCKPRKYCSHLCYTSTMTHQIKHGEGGTWRGGPGSALYGVWKSIKQRCNNPKYKSFAYYGGRGIKVCEEWQDDYALFRNWAMANGYSRELEIDRKDNNKGYSPDNCRWVTRQQNMMNVRKKKSGVSCKYKGVQPNGKSGWIAQICHHRKVIRLGRFSTALAAAIAYDDMAVKLNGEFALLNFQERMTIYK